MDVDVDLRAYDALSEHPRLVDLRSIAETLMTAAMETRRGECPPGPVRELAAEFNLAPEQAATPCGNALEVLAQGPDGAAERALVRAIAAHVFARRVAEEPAGETHIAEEILWLAAHTSFDATSLLDRALGDRAATLWDAIADRVKHIEASPLHAIARGEVLVGCVAIASSRTAEGARRASDLSTAVSDPKLARMLANHWAEGPSSAVSGELAEARRAGVLTAILAFTGILFLVRLAGLLAKLTLAYRRPAELEVSRDGVRLRWRAEMLGRTLLERNVVVPREALLHATREVRYPRLALYVGLLALAVGSYVGVSAFVDGGRVASPTLLGWGLLLVVLGLALDFVLSSLAPGAKGRCRIILATRDGSRLCIGGVDVRRADAILEHLSKG